MKLIWAFLTAGMFAIGLVSPMAVGTPQGGPLSPLLSNSVLDELDAKWHGEACYLCGTQMIVPSTCAVAELGS